MLRSYPSAWLLLSLPFVSSLVIRSVPLLRRSATVLNRLTRPIGLLGLVCLFAGLLGLLPSPCALPVALVGGLVSGYTVFSLPTRGSDSDDWRRPGPPPEDPPSPPGDGGPIDWDQFDRLRIQWERMPVARR